MNVITYAFAYVPGQISLCAKHAADPPAPLGPVQHGRHEGICDGCTFPGLMAQEWRDVLDDALGLVTVTAAGVAVTDEATVYLAACDEINECGPGGLIVDLPARARRLLLSIPADERERLYALACETATGA